MVDEGLGDRPRLSLCRRKLVKLDLHVNARATRSPVEGIPRERTARGRLGERVEAWITGEPRLPDPKLRERLLKDGQILNYAAPPNEAKKGK